MSKKIAISKIRAIVANDLQLTTTIYQFVKRDGSRRLRQPFWISNVDTEGPEGKSIRTFQFNYINEQTDIEQLVLHIENCCVWTRPIYIQKALEFFPDKFHTGDT